MVEQLYVAVVKMVDSGDKVRVDQAHLETVIPAIGQCLSGQLFSTVVSVHNFELNSTNYVKF